MTVLRGPADADRFRVKVGRYGDRWYIDPLPACELAPDGPMAEPVPSVSIVKNAWPKFLTAWAAKEAAKCAVHERNVWANMPAAAAETFIAAAHNRSRDRAANRGTAVHHILERLAEGRDPAPLEVVEAADYLDVCQQIVDDLSPELVLSEAVAVSRTVGYGGTLDAVWRIGGDVCLVDFKSKAEGKHGAWPDEAAQLAAYLGADYVLVDDGSGRPVRRPVPPVDRVLIVSIEPSSYRLFPVNIPEASEAWRALHRFWTAQQATIVGHPIHLEASSRNPAPAVDAPVETVPDTTPADPALVDWLKGRVRRLVDAGHGAALAARWPLGVPTFKAGGPATVDDCRRLEQVVVDLDADAGLPFPDNERPRPAAPDVDTASAVPAGPDPAEVAAGLLSVFAVDERAALIRVCAPAARNLDHRFNRAELDRLRFLLDAANFRFDGYDGERVNVTVDADGLADRYGDKRAVVAQAKKHAERFGLPKPSSYAEVCASTLLVVALLTHAPVDTAAA